MTRDLTTEHLDNGLIRVFDCAAKWATLYTVDGRCVAGVDRDEYRDAIMGR